MHVHHICMYTYQYITINLYTRTYILICIYCCVRKYAHSILIYVYIRAALAIHVDNHGVQKNNIYIYSDGHTLRTSDFFPK